MTNAEQDKVSVAYGKVIVRAQSDPAFKAKLLADPHGTLEDQGVPVPAGMTVKVVENTDKHFHFVLLPKPAGALSDEALEKVVAAGGYNVITWDPRGEWNSAGTDPWDLPEFRDFRRE